MNECKIIAVWAVVLFVNIQTQSAEIRVGEQNITISSPSGFSEISSISPEISQLGKDMVLPVPPTNRLLAVFISQDDIDSLIQGEDGQFNSFMTVQSVKKIESLSFTEDQFNELRAVLRSQFDTIFDTMAELSGRSISKTIDEEVDYNVGDIVPLGIDSETESSITASMFTTDKLTVAGEFIEDITAVTWCMLLVNGKIISLHVYRAYNETSDLEWTRQTTQSWANSILSENNITPPLGSPIKTYGVSFLVAWVSYMIYRIVWPKEFKQNSSNKLLEQPNIAQTSQQNELFGTYNEVKDRTTVTQYESIGN